MKSVFKDVKNKVPKHTETTKQVRKDWDRLFEKAIVGGDTPKNDMFKGMKNDFDDSEW